MKKGFLLIAVMALVGFGFAQQTLIYDSFEEYTVGNHIAAEANAAGHSWWTTWSGVWGHQPGTDEDGLVSGDYASDGVKSAYISNNNDNVLLLGEQTEGEFELSFDVYTPLDGIGYFNLGMPRNTYPSWEYAMEVYINAEYGQGNPYYSPGHGSVVIGTSVVADLSCVQGEWMNFIIQYSASNYYTSLYCNDELILSDWMNFNAVDFCGNANLSYSGFYLDNFNFVRLDVFPTAEFTITPESIEETMGMNEEKTIEITLTNIGDAIGNWAAYFEFEQGGSSSWAAIDKISGAVPAGGTDYITLTLNTFGLTNPYYEARLYIMVSSRDRTILEIPIIVHLDTNAVDELSSPKVKVYPNPTHSLVTLEGDHLEGVSIYNAVGQLVRMEVLNDGTNTLDLDLEEGVYFFHIEDNNGNHTVQRVVVVR